MNEDATVSRGCRGPARRGLALVWVAILLIVFVGIVALALDWGYAFWTAQKLQNAADAAALAGARQVWFSHADARAQAIAIAAENEAGGVPVQLADNPSNDPDGDVIIGHYDSAARTFTPTLEGETNAVAVNARRTEGSLNGPLPLVWGGIFGITQTQLTRWAIAVATGGPAGDSVIALDPDDRWSFHMHGTPDFDLGSGRVQVNSSDDAGARMNGTPDLLASDVNVVGDYRFDGYSPPPDLNFNSGRPFVSDPLADLPEPDPADYTQFNKISGSGTFSEGYYPNGLDLKAGNAVFLNPGVYILDKGFNINGHAELTGYGVMFFIRSGSVRHNGTGDSILTPPADGDYQSIQFFQARGNSSGARFNGNGKMSGASDEQGMGTLYFPAAKLELGGTGDAYYINSLIANNIEVYGNGYMQITRGYEAAGGGDKVYLVE